MEAGRGPECVLHRPVVPRVRVRAHAREGRGRQRKMAEER